MNFMCPSAGDSGFFVTFCPEGDGDSAGTGEGQSQPTGLAETTGQDDEAGYAADDFSAHKAAS